MSSVNKKEIEKFSNIAAEWWDPHGKFKPLHKFNPIRIKYIKENIIEQFKIKEHYDKQNTADSNERWQNIEELINGIVEYNEKEDANLVQFLEDVSLLTDIDKMNDDSDQVTLMTIHSSKGLEYPIVFISGL